MTNEIQMHKCQNYVLWHLSFVIRHCERPARLFAVRLRQASQGLAGGSVAISSLDHKIASGLASLAKTGGGYDCFGAGAVAKTGGG